MILSLHPLGEEWPEIFHDIDKSIYLGREGIPADTDASPLPIRPPELSHRTRLSRFDAVSRMETFTSEATVRHL